MKRQDEEKYGGLREAVLARDGRRCRACPNIERRKLGVHHRVPGVSKLELMITLCTACHAIVERTQMVLGEMTSLLLVLWREKHPDGKEQLCLALDSELPGETTQALIPIGYQRTHRMIISRSKCRPENRSSTLFSLKTIRNSLQQPPYLSQVQIFAPEPHKAGRDVLGVGIAADHLEVAADAGSRAVAVWDSLDAP
jgi:hypothetical protein